MKHWHLSVTEANGSHRVGALSTTWPGIRQEAKAEEYAGSGGGKRIVEIAECYRDCIREPEVAA